MTNLEKIANVFDELGCNIDFAKDGSFIVVHYEITRDEDTTYHFSASFENMEDYNLNNIDWEEELKIRFDFEEELNEIETDFCRLHMQFFLECKSIRASNAEYIAHEWDDEVYYIRAEFEEFCTNFERLIKKYTNREVLEKFQKAVDNCEYGDGIIEKDGDKYYLVVDYSVDNEEGDIIRATTEIIEGKYVENILDELEGDFCKYDLDSLGESEANALRHAFFENYLPALKKELGVK